MGNSKPSSHQRRSFLTRLNTGLGSIAAIPFGGRAAAQVKSSSPGRWEPARHSQDDWMEELPGKHRLIFDTVSDKALDEALLFANNFIIANRNDYGLSNSEVSIIIVVRHLSTAL